MTPDYLDQLGQAALGAGVLIGGAFTGYQSHKARREAARAARNSHPVSNGWGTKVSRDLDYVVEAVDRLHQRQDATDRRQTAADERDTDMGARINAAAHHARTAAEQSASVAAGLAAHLADHASEDARTPERTP